MRILNADGSEVESCGNAARCVAAILLDEGRGVARDPGGRRAGAAGGVAPRLGGPRGGGGRGRGAGPRSAHPADARHRGARAARDRRLGGHPGIHDPRVGVGNLLSF